MRAFLAIVPLALAASAHASAGREEVFTPTAACPQGSAIGDGCGGQLPRASFQRNPATFPDYVTGYDTAITGTGLTRAGNIRAALAGAGPFGGAKQINFNLPGVQYPVGDDPTTQIQAQYYDTAHGGPGYPTGCSYTNGGGANGTSHRVLCGASSTNPTLANIDFTNGGTDCVTLESSGVVGVLTVNNARFEYRGNCVGLPGKSNAWLVDIFAPSTAMTGLAMRNITMNGNPRDCTGCITHPLSGDILVASQSNMVVTVDYLAATGNTGRFINGGTTAAGYSYKYYITHSYLEGVSLGCMTYGQHGELESMNANPLSTGNVQAWSYDTLVVPPWQPFYPHFSMFHDQGCLTAPLYLSTGGGGAGSSWSDDEDHVLSIVNLPASGHMTATAATVEISYDNYPNASDVTVTSVWADPKGAGQCAVNAGGATGVGATNPMMSIVDLYDASVITNFDNSPKCAGHANP